MKRYSYIFTVLPILLLIIIGASCSSMKRVTSVTSADFEKNIIDHDVQLLDVRTPKEYAEGHIAGAVNIDVNSPAFLPDATAAIDKDKPVYVYCRGGVRSKKAAKKLAKKGYTIIDLDHGILGWQADGKPVITD